MKRKKQRKSDKPEFTFAYADIETLAPQIDPHFWIGGVKQDGDYRAYESFKDYWNDLTSRPKGKKKVVVFHNSKYDMSILRYHAQKELGYTVNPKQKGHTKSIYTGQYEEIYTNNNVSPVFVVDSLNLLPGSLRKYGDQIGAPKGETPIVTDYRRPTKQDWDYLKRDVEILEQVFQSYGHEESVQKGLLTISAVAQSSVKTIYSSLTGTTPKTTGLKRKHSAREKKDKTPLPTAVSKQIETDTERFRAREVVYSIETKRALYGVNEDVCERYKKYIRKYWLERLTEENANFEEMQKHAKAQVNNKACDKALVKAFFELELPDGQSPHGKHLADEFNKSKVIEGCNRMIAPSMRGGISYANMDYVGKTLENGGVLDVNSLYPFILSKYGLPCDYVGSTEDLDPDLSKYFIAVINRLKARVKPGKHPFLKRNTKFTNDKIYDTEIDWEVSYKNGIADTVLCSADINWLFENYYVEEISYGKVYYFEENKTFTKAVKDHIVYWRKKKENATNVVDRTYAKFMLNTIWGRWGMFEKEVEEGAYKIDIGDKDTNYVSAIFTTAYARIYLNKMMNWFGRDLVYTDTDSVHFLFGNKIKDEKDLKKKLGALMDSNEFGKWDFETKWSKAKYIKAKTYAMVVDDNVKTVTAGRQLPRMESIEEFELGKSYAVTENKTDGKGRKLIYESIYTLTVH